MHVMSDEVSTERFNDLFIDLCLYTVNCIEDHILDSCRRTASMPDHTDSIHSQKGDATNVLIIEIAQRGLNEDRKSTRLNSSHVAISYAVLCLKKKANEEVETCS